MTAASARANAKFNVLYVWWALLLGVVIVFPFVHDWPFFDGYIGPFRTFQATMFAVWLLVTLGMNLLTGYSGQISLGHAALVTVGAYTTAILFDQYNWPMAPAVLAGGVVTGAIGFLLGFPSVRLTGPYLAIATLATVLALPQVLKFSGDICFPEGPCWNVQLTDWTNGSLGIRIRTPQPPGFVDGFLDAAQWAYYTTIASAGIMAVLAWNIMRSRLGRAFVALRDSEVGAVHMGINLPLYKAMAFGLSAFYAGLGGGFLFMVQAFISPDTVDLLTSIKFLVAIVLGGLASVLGSIIGAVFLTAENDIIELAGRFIPNAERLRWAIFGTILIVVMIAFPRGVAGAVQELVAMGPRGWLRSGQDLWRRLVSLTPPRAGRTDESE